MEGSAPSEPQIAVWREAGRWWDGEAYREFRRFLDERGIQRESVDEFPSLSRALSERMEEQPYEEDHREEWAFRMRKIRDEKVARANGWLPRDDATGLLTESQVLDDAIVNENIKNVGAGQIDDSPPIADNQDPRNPVGNSVPLGSKNVGTGRIDDAPPIADNQDAIVNEKTSPFTIGIVKGEKNSHLQPDSSQARNDNSPSQCDCEGIKSTISYVSIPSQSHCEGDNDAPGFSSTESVRPPTTQTPAQPCLHVLSGYSFGRSSMLAEEIPVLCADMGIPAVLVADIFSLTGAMEHSKAAKKAGIKPLIGATFEMAEGGEIVLVARTRNGYRSLCRLISECHLGEPRLFPLCTWERLERHREDLLCLTGGHPGLISRLLLAQKYGEANTVTRRLIDLYGRDNVFIQIERSYYPFEKALEGRLLELASHCGVRPVAGGPITHAKFEHFPAQDVLICIDTLCAIEEIDGRKPGRKQGQTQVEGPPRRALNAERYLHSPAEMRALFVDRPDLLENTWAVAERCDPWVMPPRTELPKLYPDEFATLREITYAGARARYPKIGSSLHRRMENELNRIEQLGFAGHFLVAWDMCRWARENRILFSGRGSVVDSVVAFALGLSRIDAHHHNLHFDRFLPADGSKRPDIDIDFEAAKRNDVREYLTKKYGEDHVATVGAVGAYCSRGIVREVSKVFGIPPETIGYFAKRIHGGVSPDNLRASLKARPELRNSNIPADLFEWVFALSPLLMDVPRNMRSHSSGVVISRTPIMDTVPVLISGLDSVKIMQWDKRSAKHVFDKFDVLCLRGQDVLGRTQEQIRLFEDFDVEDISLEDPDTYATMRSGHLIGVPQSASPAMRQAHVRLGTMDLKDASLVQAGIRPGVGGAVKINELIARRRGKPYSFQHPKLEKILGHTYGIIVFQEQVDQLLQEFGNYTSGEAEATREAIYEKRREKYAAQIKEEVISRVLAQGYAQSVAEEVYDLVSGFQGYGFAEGHALAFAEISIRSVWCQQHYPAEYFAALLNSQPAGYYGPCTLANEARIRGVRMLPVDVNASGLEFSVEDVRSEMDPRLILPRAGIRVALHQISGVSSDTLTRISLNGVLDFIGDRIVNIPSQCDCEGIGDVLGSSPAGSDRMPISPDPNTGIITPDFIDDAIVNENSPSQSHCEGMERLPPPFSGAARSPAPEKGGGLGWGFEFSMRRGSLLPTPPDCQQPRPRRYTSFFDFVARVRPARDELERLILCGALDSLHHNRRAMLWAIPSALNYASSVAPSQCDDDAIVNEKVSSFTMGIVKEEKNDATGLPTESQVSSRSPDRCGDSVGRPVASISACDSVRRPVASVSPDPNTLPLTNTEPPMPMDVADFPEQEKAIWERDILGMDVQKHLMAWEREHVQARGGITGAQAMASKDGTKCFVVGHPIRLRFPPTQSGRRVVFFDLEDETGLLNVTCFDETYQRYGHAIICNPYVTVVGIAQARDNYMGFLAEKIFPYRANLRNFTTTLPLTMADFLVR